MFRVSYETHPDDPEFANAPEMSDVLDTQEEADAWADQITAGGGRVTENYEMSEGECVHRNMNVHGHGW